MTQPKRQNTPDYMGHRQRLRDRFLRTNGEGLEDYELLELVLAMAIPRRDVKPIARELLRKFDDLPGVMNASHADLSVVKGIGDVAATSLKVVKAAALRMMRQQILEKPLLSSWEDLLAYCHAAMAQERKEHLRVIFLDQKNRILAEEVQQSGTVNHTPIYPREVLKRALELHASGIVLVHNHPSGDPTPSQADIRLTRDLAATAKPLGIILHDHLIISKTGYKSLKSDGLL